MKLFIGGIQTPGNAQRAAGWHQLPEVLSPHALPRIYGHMALAAGKKLWHVQSVCSVHRLQEELGTHAQSLHKYRENVCHDAAQFAISWQRKVFRLCAARILSVTVTMFCPPHASLECLCILRVTGISTGKTHVTARYPEHAAAERQRLCCRLKPSARHMCIVLTDYAAMRISGELMDLPARSYLQGNVVRILSEAGNA